MNDCVIFNNILHDVIKSMQYLRRTDLQGKMSIFIIMFVKGEPGQPQVYNDSTLSS